MSLFDVLVTQGDADWNVGAVSSSVPKSGVLVEGVEAADVGSAAKAVSVAVGLDINEAWRVWPAGEETLVGSPSTAS
ncbi:MAG TPA: hypothetical protein VK730_13580 [Solirubrobacteraceae bacterium]|jgi:hypothetical protein|nr:hypothetical protein [Solirubrobacteraceae bacterium]